MAPPQVKSTKLTPQTKKTGVEINQEAEQWMSEGEIILWFFLLGSSGVITLIADLFGLTGIGLIATLILDVYPACVNLGYTARLGILGKLTVLDVLLAISSILVPGTTLFSFSSKLKSITGSVKSLEKLKTATAPVQKATSLNTGKLKAITRQTAEKTSIISGRTQTLQSQITPNTATQAPIEVQQQVTQENQPTQQIQYTTNEAGATQSTPTPEQVAPEAKKEESEPESTILTDAASFYFAPETSKEYAQLITTDSEQVQKTETTISTTATPPKPSPTAIATQGRLAEKRSEVGKEEDQKIEVLTQSQNQAPSQSTPSTSETIPPETSVIPRQQKEGVYPTIKTPQIKPVPNPEPTLENLTDITTSQTKPKEQREGSGVSETSSRYAPETPKESNSVFTPFEQFAKPPTTSQLPQTYINKDTESPIAPYPTYNQVVGPETQYPESNRASQVINIELPNEATNETELQTEYPEYPIPTPETQQLSANTGSANIPIKTQRSTNQQTAQAEDTKKPSKTPDIFKEIEAGIEEAGSGQNKQRIEQKPEEPEESKPTTIGTSQNILDLRHKRAEHNKAQQRAIEAAQTTTPEKPSIEETRKSKEHTDTNKTSVVESIEKKREEKRLNEIIQKNKEKQEHIQEVNKNYSEIIGQTDAIESNTQDKDDQQHKKAA